MKLFKWIIIAALVLGFLETIFEDEVTYTDISETKTIVQADTSNEEIVESAKLKVNDLENMGETIFSNYLQYWKYENYKGMYDLAQSSWKTNNKEDVIKAYYNFKDLEEFTVLSSDQISDIAYKVTAKVRYKGLTGENEIKTVKAMVIKEDGTWGVNPTSALREE